MTVPRVFGLPHLSEDAVAAFADGVLSPAAAIRAERHCAECAECAAAVWGQREAAMMLRAAATPSMPSGLLDRLAGVPMSTPLPPPLSGLPTVVGDDGVPMFVAHKTENEPESGSGSVFRRGTFPMGLLASAAAVVAAGTFGSHLQSVASEAHEHNAPAAVSQITSANRSASNGTPSSTTQAPVTPVSFGAGSFAVTSFVAALTVPRAAVRPHFGAVRGMP
jgi:anti-sigma factor RsiW